MPLPKYHGRAASDRIDMRDIAMFRKMELFAHKVVEGFITGQHKSPFKGFAIEFAEHRAYVQGDDLKHFDWKMLAKADRKYIKQYEEDTALRAYLLVDASGSMGYKSGAYSKYDYARFIAGVLAYMMIGQQDSTGLITFTSKVEKYLPARTTKRHLKNMLDTLNETETGDDTQLAEVMHQLANRIRRRALVVIISDFFDDPENLILALNHFAHKKHEVVLFQVLDRKEEDFPFRELLRFEDLEGQEHILTEPLRVKREYQRQFREHERRLLKACHHQRIDFVKVYTDKPVETQLAKYLTLRLRRSK
jgi:uncharacterized protein (DUF58 family)